MNMPLFLEDDEIEMPLAPAGFQVHDERSAAWAAEKVVEAEERVRRIERQAERNLARAEKELARARAFFIPMLRAWAEANPPKRGRTIHLATGDLSFRRVNGGIFVQNEEACLEWAETKLPEAIRREVVRKLDFERAKREGERVFTEACVDVFVDPPAVQGNSPIEVALAMEAALDEAAKKLPPGMVRRQDSEVFEVRAPKGGK